jgi:hypothetical protein
VAAVRPSSPEADLAELTDRSLLRGLVLIGAAVILTVAYVVQASLPPYGLRLPGQETLRATVRQDWGFFSRGPDVTYLRAVVLDGDRPVEVAAGVADVELTDARFGRDGRRLRGELDLVAAAAEHAGARWGPCPGGAEKCGAALPAVPVGPLTPAPRVGGDVVLERTAAAAPPGDTGDRGPRPSVALRLLVRC